MLLENISGAVSKFPGRVIGYLEPLLMKSVKDFIDSVGDHVEVSCTAFLFKFEIVSSIEVERNSEFVFDIVNNVPLLEVVNAGL